MFKKNNHQLIIGLGNPTEKYKNTRHNVGFIVLDVLKEKLGFQDFSFSKKFDAEISESTHTPLLQKMGLSSDKKIILVKPQTYMNKSGQSVQRMMSFYKLSHENIIVINDDLDIIIGNYKTSKGSGAAGHKGVQDIIEKIGTKDFLRIKVGVEKKEGRHSRKTPGEKFVLQNFTDDEMKDVKEVAEKISKDILSTKK